MAVVVQDTGSARGGCGGDQIVGSGDAPLTAQLTGGSDGCRADATRDVRRRQGGEGPIEIRERLFVAGRREQLERYDRA